MSQKCHENQSPETVRANYERFGPVVLRAPDVDWIKFDAALARDGSVEPVAKALYAALASFADPTHRGTDPAADDEIPTRRRLAACIGKSVDTVDRATKRLEEIGLLEVERRRDPANPRSHIPSVYRLLDRERWDERAVERVQRRQAERAAERAARKRQQAADEPVPDVPDVPEMPSNEDVPDTGGWPHGCGQGGRMGAAVPLLVQKSLLHPSQRRRRRKPPFANPSGGGRARWTWSGR